MLVRCQTTSLILGDIKCIRLMNDLGYVQLLNHNCLLKLVLMSRRNYRKHLL